jgi:hypothetical protein
MLTHRGQLFCKLQDKYNPWVIEYKEQNEAALTYHPDKPGVTTIQGAYGDVTWGMRGITMDAVHKVGCGMAMY